MQGSCHLTCLPQGGAEARYDIAVDLVQAGPGDTVLVLDEGSSARQLLNAEPNGPVRAVIVGIVDAIDLPETGL